MKVHKLLYFYWSLPTATGGINGARGLNDHTTFPQREKAKGKGKGRSRKCGSSDFTVDRLIDFRERKRAALVVWCASRNIHVQRTKIFLSFFPPPRWIFHSEVSERASESLIFLCRVLEYSTERFMGLCRLGRPEISRFLAVHAVSSPPSPCRSILVCLNSLAGPAAILTCPRRGVAPSRTPRSSSSLLYAMRLKIARKYRLRDHR